MRTRSPSSDYADVLTKCVLPFGKSIRESGSNGGSNSYAGEWTDATGLQYPRARYYASQQGRFISEDPFLGSLTQPASLTPYVYALTNPLRYTDPSGEFVPIAAVAGIGFAAAALYDADQQTNGFTDSCRYNIALTLAWGVGVSFGAWNGLRLDGGRGGRGVSLLCPQAHNLLTRFYEILSTDFMTDISIVRLTNIEYRIYCYLIIPT